MRPQLPTQPMPPFGTASSAFAASARGLILTKSRVRPSYAIWRRVPRSPCVSAPLWAGVPEIPTGIDALCMFGYSECVTPRRRANFYLDDELLAGLKALKARVGIPESEAVRRAVAEYLGRQGVATDRKAERKRVAPRKRP